MEVKSFEFNFFGEKTYVVFDHPGGSAAIIDPGMMNHNEECILDNFISSNNLTVEHIITTHLHVDHVMGYPRLQEKYKLGISANPDDEFLGSRIVEQVQMFRLPIQLQNVKITHKLSAGDIIRIGNGELNVISVPGHSPGSIALYSEKDGFVITGDALFKQSIGRTDLPGGDYATLINSITSNLMTLPDSTIVYPGHGPATTIGEERRLNPYI